VHYAGEDLNDDGLKDILLNEYGISVNEFVLLQGGRMTVDDNSGLPSEIASPARDISNNDDVSDPPSIKVRKRCANPQLWKRNATKQLRQSGKSFINARGKHRQARRVVEGTACRHPDKLKFECSKFSDMQQDIHKHFWSLTDQDKCQFYARTTERYPKKANRSNNYALSRRKYTFAFFFIKDGMKLKVCRTFYLKTLDVSAKRIEFS